MTSSVLGNGRVCVWSGKLIALRCRNRGQVGEMLTPAAYLPVCLVPSTSFCGSLLSCLCLHLPHQPRNLPQGPVSREAFVATHVWRPNEKVLLLKRTVCNERPGLLCMTQISISTNLTGTREVNRDKHLQKGFTWWKPTKSMTKWDTKYNKKYLPLNRGYPCNPYQVLKKNLLHTRIHYPWLFKYWIRNSRWQYSFFYRVVHDPCTEFLPECSAF